MTPFLLSAAIFLFAGFVQGFTGFGAALLAIPLLSLFLDIKLAVPLTVLAGLVITTTLSLALKRSLDLRKLRPLFLGALPGIAIGTLILRDLPSGLLRLILGGTLIAYALYGLLFHLSGRRLHVAWAYLAGLASGVLGTTLSTIGPPTIIYTSLTTWTRDEVKATLSGFFLAGSAVTAVAHLAAGLTTSEVLVLFLAVSPAVLLGVAAGLIVSKRTAERDFRRWVFGLLLLMGLGLLAL